MLNGNNNKNRERKVFVAWGEANSYECLGCGLRGREEEMSGGWVDLSIVGSWMRGRICVSKKIRELGEGGTRLEAYEGKIMMRVMDVLIGSLYE
jgi:hypothetical protein